MTARPLSSGQVRSVGDEEREQGVVKCPSCGARQLGCFIREAEIGSWCCGDCTAHHGQHEWAETPHVPTQPERPQR